MPLGAQMEIYYPLTSSYYLIPSAFTAFWQLSFIPDSVPSHTAHTTNAAHTIHAAAAHATRIALAAHEGPCYCYSCCCCNAYLYY